MMYGKYFKDFKIVKKKSLRNYDHVLQRLINYLISMNYYF